ncbi:hypothetical protein C8R45DRAFT_926886 [Mycena sanguinolenta]|nr:hypothetical protein C8R45DRAFT_926886 [Mycena sanguinolenta]
MGYVGGGIAEAETEGSDNEVASVVLDELDVLARVEELERKVWLMEVVDGSGGVEGMGHRRLLWCYHRKCKLRYEWCWGSTAAGAAVFGFATVLAAGLVNAMLVHGTLCNNNTPRCRKRESIPPSSLLQIIRCESPCYTAASTLMYSNNNWVENQAPEAQMWMQQGADSIAEFVAAAGPSTVSESRTSTSALPPRKRLKLGPLKGCGVQRDGIAISAANYVKKYWDEFKEEYPEYSHE